MKPYSQDRRQRVVRAVDEGRPRAEIVHLFGVSFATIKRYLKQRRETGELTPKVIPGRPAKKGGVLDAQLRTQLEAHRDGTLEEPCRLGAASHGMKVSTASMSRASPRLGWTRKKTHWSPVNATKPLGLPGVSKRAS